MKLLDQIHGVGEVDIDGINGVFLCRSHCQQLRTQQLVFALDSAELLQNSSEAFLKMQPGEPGGQRFEEKITEIRLKTFYVEHRKALLSMNTISFFQICKIMTLYLLII